jgi:hypothetical protein
MNAQQKMMSKIQKKSHLRSLTSHKLVQPKISGHNTTNNASLMRKDDLNKDSFGPANASPAVSANYKVPDGSKFTTIDQNEETESTPLRQAERQPVHQS